MSNISRTKFYFQMVAAKEAAIFITGCGLEKDSASTQKFYRKDADVINADKSVLLPDSSPLVLLDVNLFCDTGNIIKGVGEIMLGTNFPLNRNYLPPNVGKDALSPGNSFLRNADVTFGNMEGAISDNAPLEKRGKHTSKCCAYL